MTGSTKGRVLEAVEQFLDAHSLSDADAVVGELARKLAQEIEAGAIPAYALSKSITALAALMAGLQAAVEPEADAEANLAWLREAEAS
jgi:hypothetical protein